LIAWVPETRIWELRTWAQTVRGEDTTRSA